MAVTTGSDRKKTKGWLLFFILSPTLSISGEPITVEKQSPLCRHAEIHQTLSGVAHLKSWAEETGQLSGDDLLISASVDEGG